MPRPPVLTALALSATLALAATPACASELASLHASFSPDRLATPTTISFSFHLSTPQGAAPPPLQSIDLHMPAGMNYTSTTLGLALCQPAALLAHNGLEIHQSTPITITGCAKHKQARKGRTAHSKRVRHRRRSTDG